MKETNMIEQIELDTNDYISFLVASAALDFKNTGHTNAYHINKKTELTLIYNDKSILENHYISESFKVICEVKSNIFSNFNTNEIKLIRKRIISLIIATDMSFLLKYIHQ